MTRHHLFATTPKYMEPLLADELRGLGAEEVAQRRAGAAFTGTLETAYRVCLWSRLANRVLLVLARFGAPTADALYRGVRGVSWHEHFDTAATFAVRFSASQSAITHSHYGALRVKDAIVDHFRARGGERPSVNTERPDIRVDVYLRRDEATLCLDLSGESLHRRGYREGATAAPMKENLAAAILIRSGWPEIARGGGALVDPMCGSGTLPIEAALMAADGAPGLQRDHWGFIGWKGHDAAAWEAIVAEARERRTRGLAHLPAIRGYDGDAAAVRAALKNVDEAGLRGLVHIERRELEAAASAHPGDNGLVVTNPPYGTRMGAAADLPALYGRLGALLKDRFPGWRAAVFTGDPALGRQLGLRARHIHKLYNGPIECVLLHFEIAPQWFVSGHRQPRPLPVEQRSPGAEMFANRLRKNLRHLGRWARREGVQCYRLYDADLPEYALAIDVYDGERRRVHVQEYAAPHSIDAQRARQRLREAIGVTREVLSVGEDALFFKVRRRQKGGAQYERLASGGRFHEVREGGCRFLVNFEDYLDTGLFLDHRLTRALLARLAGGRRFLNLFAYTGTATVCAARGGAASTTSVDLSGTYLSWAQRNMALNGLTGGAHEFVQANCLKWLARSTGQRRYGLIFLGPPTFSASTRMTGTFDVQRDHVSLITAALRLLEPDGILIFSNNLRRFRIDREALAGLLVEDISRETLPPDFERNPRIHNCWRIRPPGPQRGDTRAHAPELPGPHRS